MFDTSRECAQRLDAEDALSGYRRRFYIPDGAIYMDGNSLGLLSREAETAVLRLLDSWKRLGVEGWLQADPCWFTLAEELGKGLASVIGSAPEETVAVNSTTVNLHQLLATLYRPEPERYQILCDALIFPSDLYAIESHLRLRGLDPKTAIVRVRSRDGYTLEEADIEAAMTGAVALAVLPGVLYKCGQLLDMRRLTAAARARDILIGFDCSHSIGAVPHQLSAWGADFAFWCSYKYLNGGPGAVGGLYLNRRHAHRFPGLVGWFGSDKSRQFDLDMQMTPAQGAGALQIGTPHLLSMAPLCGSLHIFQEAGIEAVRKKSLRLTDYLMWLAERELAPLGVRIATPRAPNRRGGHVALLHPEAMRICMALRREGVIPDHRPPDIIRLAPAALYVSFEEVRETVQRLKRILSEERYRDVPTEREKIT
jgi:kynureninase